MIYKVGKGNGIKVASRMLKLAWDSSSVIGMGFLQDQGPGISEEEILESRIL